MVRDSLISSGAPSFVLPVSIARSDVVTSASSADYRGRWLILIFYPRDFSFVCPTELIGFSLRVDDFRERNCDLLGISTDTIESHAKWLRTSPAEGGVGELGFPLASDPDGATSRAYGVWSNHEEVSFRGTFIIDPDGIVQYGVVHNLAVGRSVDETLRVLEALQSGGLCPASWTSADGNIDLENALKPGRVLGQYQIRRVLGDGSFGRVFAAWDTRLERAVALKVMRQQTRQSRDDVLREARAAAPLRHPNLCLIYSVDEIDGLLVIAMELLDGQNLAAYLNTETALIDRLRIAEGIAAGLAAAHAHRVIHGDLKPDNILIDLNLVPRILDFGLASKKDPLLVRSMANPAVVASVDGIAHGMLDETVRMAVDGESGSNVGISGTPAYMAPEQWASVAVTTANDIYAFGLILFELVTRRRAFPETNLQQLLQRIQDRELPYRLASQLPQPLTSLCQAMLNHDPAGRPSAEQVCEALRAVVRHPEQLDS